MSLAILAGSVAGVVLIVVVAWALGLGGGPFADADAACREAEAQVPGFRAVAAELTANGARVTGVDGRVVTLVAHGAQWIVAR